MSKPAKTKTQILSGQHDKNIRFNDAAALLLSLGFSHRIRGSHHIFALKNIKARINIQPNQDGTCKDYQIRQIRKLFKDYLL